MPKIYGDVDDHVFEPDDDVKFKQAATWTMGTVLHPTNVSVTWDGRVICAMSV